MSRVRAAAAIAAAAAVAGCGSTAHFADKSTPPTAINLSVYVNDRQVSVSPASVGAGPVNFLVSNGAATTELITVRRAGGGGNAANTGPINPGSTSQVQADLATGTYTVRASPSGGAIGRRAIRPAVLHIGRPRANANGALLEP